MKNLLLFLFLVGSVMTPVSGEEGVPAEDETGNPFQKDKVDKAIEKGILYISKKQQSDGSIHDRGNPTTMTALSLMAMAAVGNQPVNPNEEGRVMRRALDYVLKEDRQDEHGYFGNKDGGRMYGHGIVTLTLSEML